MKKEFYKSASLLHSALRIETNCYKAGKIIPATQIVAIDDDITSAMWAAKIFYEIHKEHGYYPIILCVGGKGLISKLTHKKSEAELLSYVLQKLGVEQSKIVILGKGCNCGDNVIAVNEHTEEDANTIWCVTQRLSLRLERTQALQAPSLKSSYFVIEQSIDDVMKVYNGKGFCDGQILLHELASILNRCEAYSGIYQKQLDFKVGAEVKKAAKLLEKNFRLKLPRKNMKSYFQLVQVYFSLLKNKKKMQYDLEKNVLNFAEMLLSEGFINDDKSF